MKKIISNILAVLWFFCIVIEALFFSVITILIIIFQNILGMLKSGFTSSTMGFFFLVFFGLIFAVTGWVPAFRKCYYKLPWLYPLSMMLGMHLFSLSIAEVIIAKGFSVISTPRHVITIVIMIVQVIVCRAVMCLYLKKHPMILHKYDRAE